jgi:hypothetical protein
VSLPSLPCSHSRVLLLPLQPAVQITDRSEQRDVRKAETDPMQEVEGVVGSVLKRDEHTKARVPSLFSSLVYALLADSEGLRSSLSRDESRTVTQVFSPLFCSCLSAFYANES